MSSIMTVLGLIPTSGLGMILPHEHIFTDLRGPRTPGYAEGNPDDVVRQLRPYIDEIKAQGITALVEASTCGVGRNIAVLRALSQACDLPIVAPTGAYREAFIPDELRSRPQKALAEWMVSELTEGIEGTGIRAGFIKLAASDDGLTAMEIRLLRAAARASRETGAVIASHTTVGAVARRQVEILQEERLEPRRFIWVHAHCEPDLDVHLRLARRGVYLEYDAIGAPDLPDGFFVSLLRNAWDAHCGQRILLSQDAGWYHPGEPDAPIRGYGYLVRSFIPALREAGFDDAAINTMVRENPQQAFGLEI